MRRYVIVGAMTAGLLSIAPAAALAQVSPMTGQPGAPANTCGMTGATSTPGNSASASGSPFNENGVAGQHYAGNPNTASLGSNSTVAVSQYDIACFNVTK